MAQDLRLFVIDDDPLVVATLGVVPVRVPCNLGTESADRQPRPVRDLRFLRILEAPPGFETGDGGFADRACKSILLIRPAFWSALLARFP